MPTVNFGDHHLAAGHMSAEEYLALKPGDRLVCLNAEGQTSLKHGSHYFVSQSRTISGDIAGVLIKDEKGHSKGVRYAGRFALATIAPSANQVDSNTPPGTRVRLNTTSDLFPSLVAGTEGVIVTAQFWGCQVRFADGTVGIPCYMLDRIEEHEEQLLKAFGG